MNIDTSSLRTNTNTIFATMKQEQLNHSKVVNEETVKEAKRAFSPTAVYGAESLKKDIVINSSAPLSMGLVPTAQLITLQLNNITSKPFEKLSAGPIFTSPSRGHNTPVPILAKPASPSVPRRRLCNSVQETAAFPCQKCNHFRHKSCQTEPSTLQPDAFADAFNKVAVMLDEMKVKLTSIQSKVASLESRFTTVYGDETLQSIAKSPKDGNTERSCCTLRHRHSFVLNSTRFWASRRLACRLAAEKLQQREELKSDSVSLRSSLPPPPSSASKTIVLPVRRSRRFAANRFFDDEQTAPVTKAKIAKLLMDARLEMAAEKKDHLGAQPSTSVSSSEDLKSIQSGDQQFNLPCCLENFQDDDANLPPILPLARVPAVGEEVAELSTVSGVNNNEETVATRLGSRGSSSKSVTPPSVSPSALPQLPPIPAKYRRPMLLDTSEIARQTKDMLLKCAISQRSFGQNVLGLSQGSVSDLLTRPKPWSMLTNKGREPFIRMKLFLENPRSLNGFEYNIPAGKEGVMTIKRDKSEDVSLNSQQESLSSDAADSFKSAIAIDAISSPPSATMPANSVASLASKSGNRDRLSISIRSPEAQRLLKEGFDVMKTVSDAKLLLNTTTMTQRALGNTILGLSQASVSDLLCKCRPWDQTSGNKPRESYVRLKLWVDSVRQASGLSNDVSENVAERKPKHPRTESESSVTVEAESKQLPKQPLDVLMNFFDQCPAPDPNDISELANKICSLDDVNDWFVKRRRGEKPWPLSSIIKEDDFPNANDKDSSSVPPNNRSPVSTTPLNRRKKTVPTRILPSSSDAPTESAVSSPSTP